MGTEERERTGYPADDEPTTDVVILLQEGAAAFPSDELAREGVEVERKDGRGIYARATERGLGFLHGDPRVKRVVSPREMEGGA